MKIYILGFCLIFFCSISINSFAQKPGKPAKDSLPIEDSIEYYEVEIEARQKNYMELLAGSWSIDTMRRQARTSPEALSGVFLNFLTDSTFSGNTGCNKIDGTYRLKGTSIKFLTITSTGITCERSDKETTLHRLLTQTVSAYTVNNDELLLRDGASNVVFRGRRMD